MEILFICDLPSPRLISLPYRRLQSNPIAVQAICFFVVGELHAGDYPLQFGDALVGYGELSLGAGKIVDNLDAPFNRLCRWRTGIFKELCALSAYFLPLNLCLLSVISPSRRPLLTFSV